MLFPLKLFCEHGGKWLGLLLLRHFSGGNSPDHFCWSSLGLQIFLKLLFCLFGGPRFLLFPSTAQTSAWWSWRQRGHVPVCSGRCSVFGAYSCKLLLSSLPRSRRRP